MTLEPSQLRRRQCFWLWVCGTATAALLMIASSAAADSSWPTLPSELSTD
jgi:hypothetical protein